MSKEQAEVLKLIQKYGEIRAIDLQAKLEVSSKTIHKHLRQLLNKGIIKKQGSVPKVFYTIQEEIKGNDDLNNGLKEESYLIEQEYLYVSPTGEIHRGLEGFNLWCQKNNFDVDKEKKLFVKGLKTIDGLKKDGVISAKKTILSGKKEVYLDNIFFSNFYTFDHFGKTKLGQLVYLGKSSQNRELIIEIVKIIKPALNKIITKYNVKQLCFIPPTIDRKVQFLDVLKQSLKLDLEEIKAVKVASKIKIPQKTLRKLEDRIINAKTTIAVSPGQKVAGNVLIIDDATGSGATLNETANKIRKITDKKIKIIGYSVVGSYKNFDVISEV